MINRVKLPSFKLELHAQITMATDSESSLGAFYFTTHILLEIISWYCGILQRGKKNKKKVFSQMETKSKQNVSENT